MQVIKLTVNDAEKSIYFNVNSMVSWKLYTFRERTFTLINTIDGIEWGVKETPDEITQMIYEGKWPE